MIAKSSLTNAPETLYVEKW